MRVVQITTAALVGIIASMVVVATNMAEAESVNAEADTHSETSSLYTLCPPPPKEKGGATVCPRYLKAHFSGKYDSLKQLLDNIDDRKDQARRWAQDNKRSVSFWEWVVVILSTIATVMISVNTLCNFDIRRWAIVPTAMTTTVAAMVAFYGFDESHRDNIEAQTRYAYLLQKLSSDLIAHVEDRNVEGVNREFIKSYQEAFSRAVIYRTDDYLRFLSERRGG